MNFRFWKKEKTVSLENRVQNMQIDLKHMKGKVDVIAYFLQKIEKEGLKIKVKK